VGQQKRENIHLKGGAGKAEYVARRETRDATLALPDRMLAAELQARDPAVIIRTVPAHMFATPGPDKGPDMRQCSRPGDG